MRNYNHRRTVFTIRRLETLKMLCSEKTPRPEIFRILCETEHPLTIGEIASKIKEGRNNCHHHVGKLVEHQLVKECGTTETEFGKNPVLYISAADYYRLDPTLLNGGDTLSDEVDFALFNGAMLERDLYLARDFDWLVDPDKTLFEKKVAALSPERKAKVEALLAEAFALIENADDEEHPEAIEYALNVFFLPHVDPFE